MSGILKRQHERQRQVQPAKLWPIGRLAPVNCMLMDISQGGAHLRVPTNFIETGDVLISSPAIGHQQAARIVWRDATSIGVAFNLAS